MSAKSLSADVITNLAFGLIMVLLGLVAIWQTAKYAARRGVRFRGHLVDEESNTPHSVNHPGASVDHTEPSSPPPGYQFEIHPVHDGVEHDKAGETEATHAVPAVAQGSQAE